MVVDLLLPVVFVIYNLVSGLNLLTFVSFAEVVLQICTGGGFGAFSGQGSGFGRGAGGSGKPPELFTQMRK